MKKKILIILISLLIVSGLIIINKPINVKIDNKKAEVKKVKVVEEKDKEEEIEKDEGLVFLAENQGKLNYLTNEYTYENDIKLEEINKIEDPVDEETNYIDDLIIEEKRDEEDENITKIEEEITSEEEEFEEVIEIKEDNIDNNNEEVKNPNFKEIDGKTYYYENDEIVNGLKLIDNIRYYFDFNTGELLHSNVKSIMDISYWQGDINFEELKNSNLIDGVIVRVGYGTSISDECVLDLKFQRNIEELNRLNIPYGIYIYGYAQNEEAAKKEAKFVYDSINKYNVNLSYPVFYDAEIDNYKGVKYTKSLYEKVISKFYSEMDNYGISSGVYGNLYMLTKGSLNSDLIKKNVWIAQYYNKCDYEEEHIGWQYTSSGYVPGINGRIDMNIFY